MKAIRPVHTKRISADLRELQTGQVQELCKIPVQYEQRTVTAFLRSIMRPIERKTGSPALDDPLYWSVNERMYVTACYMADMLDDGPNFALGELRLSDYLLTNTDYVSQVEFEFEGEQLLFSPLLGYQAEAIESLLETGRFEKTFLNWTAGYMAACMRGVLDEAPGQYSDPNQYQDLLAERIEKILTIPESRFALLYSAFTEAALSAQHFVHATVTRYGVVAVQVTDPVTPEGQEVAVRATARFRPRSAVSKGTLSLVAFADGAQG